MFPQDAPILVVGGRTTGLTMAAELARHGAAVRIVDASPGIDPHCRATTLHVRTLEIFQDLGIVDQVLEGAEVVRGENVYARGRRFLHLRWAGVEDAPYRFPVNLGQYRTEAILERYLRGLGVDVERRTELTAAEPRSDGVRATLRHADGREEEIETPWLVGCDGAHSTVRHLQGVDFPGEEDPHPFALADVVLEAPGARDEVHTFLTEEGPLFLFPLPEGRRLVAAAVPEDPAAGEAPGLERIQALLDERGPAGARASDPRWLTHFRIHYRVAPHYRFGRIFLAGDAVHVHSLLAGQGMNTGIQDAYNLAWKLALVARGRARESLLESYEPERRKVAEDVIATTRVLTERTEVFAELPAAERERLCRGMVAPESERRRIARHLEEIDLDYRSSPICFEPGGFADGPHAGCQAPDAGPLQVGSRTLTLFELLRGPAHTLLFFAGAGADAAKLGGLAAEAAERCGDRMRVFRVCGGEGSQPAPPPGTALVRDPEQALHRRYGAAAGDCLYLIRPDGYVGCRSRLAAPEALRAYLDRVF